ncbi:MAG: phosphatase PAP2 family protein [Oscillospiraceae bacterium]|jgi:undecaprenyl-diphosphatase|nr:phosphatase PAP2 family protein [Oscillospiraceae bacterium]
MDFSAFLPFDWSVFDWVNTTFTPGPGLHDGIDKFFSFITALGDGGVFWIFLAVIFLLFKSTRKVGVVMACALLIDVVLVNGLLKNIFDRPRPFNLDWLIGNYQYPEVIERPDSPSFPSGHTAASLAGSLGMLFGTKWSPSKGFKVFASFMVALGCLVGFSRIYLEVHYASDVLAGAVVGVLCAVLGFAVFKWGQPIYDKANAKVVAATDKAVASLKRKKEDTQAV